MIRYSAIDSTKPASVWGAIAMLTLLYGCSDSSSKLRVLGDQGEKPELRVLDATVIEGDAQSPAVLAFGLKLSGNPGGRLTVSYSLHDVSATRNEDYRVPTEGEIELAPGATRATIPVEIIGDRFVEHDETLRLSIDKVSPTVAVQRAEAIGRIVDDDKSYIHSDDASEDHSFTKLDAAGKALPASAEQWSCIRDNRTGLVWEAKSKTPGPHHRLNRYTWYNADANRNGGNQGVLIPAETGICHRPGDNDESSCNTAELVRFSNTEQLCGYRDWRLSTRFELRNLIDFSVPTPAPTIDATYFPNTINGRYWSATPNADDPRQAWNIDFWDGDSASDSKSNGNYARLVRGPAHWSSQEASCREDMISSAPDSRFVIAGNTVRDLYSGLIWQRCAEGLSGEECNEGERQLVTLAGANTLAANRRTASGKAWRLPTVKELESILELGCKSPAINTTIFPSTPIRHFWTSTNGSNQANTSWYISFFLGETYFLPRSSLFAVRLVRQ